LGGSDEVQADAGPEISGFESSFPAIDTQNEVCEWICCVAFENANKLMCLAFYSKLLLAVPSLALELLSHPLAIRAIRHLRKRQNLSGMSNGIFDYQPTTYLYPFKHSIC